MPGPARWTPVDKITLDREVFKALASDTRLDILKALDVRQKTVTELAKELELNKATVFEHLEKLAAVGLIQKLEDERKWVYWQLTWTGRRLLHPEKITLAILLSSAMGTLLTALAAAWMWAQSGLPQGVSEFADSRGAGALEAPSYDADGNASQESAASAEPTYGAPESSGRSLAADDSAFADPSSLPSTDGLHDPILLAVAIVMAVLFLALVGYAVYYWRKRRLVAAAGGAPPA